jgi:small ligand-binding sensory domain FIST
MKASASLVIGAKPREAASAAAGEALSGLGGERPDFAVVFVSEQYSLVAEELLGALQAALGGLPLVGCLAGGVIGGAREVEDQAAVSLWLASGVGPVETFAAEYLGTPSGGLFAGHRFEKGGGPYLLFCDPFTFPAEQLLQYMAGNLPGVELAGGMASGGLARRQSQLLLDGAVHKSGAVGANLAGAKVDLLVSQGCRPIGNPYTVTAAEGNVIHAIGGKPPLKRLQSLVERLPERDRALLAGGGLQVGLVTDEYRAELGRGDFVVRGIVALGPATGSIAVGAEVEVGQTVQFQLRDAASAHEDLSQALERELLQLDGEQPSGALVFSCNGRGARFFEEPDHDARMVTKFLGEIPLAGFFCAGELGPVAGKNFLHAFSCVVAVFR